MLSHYACFGKLDELKQAIANDVNPNEHPSYGLSPLISAIVSKHQDAAEYLINDGAIVNPV